MKKCFWILAVVVMAHAGLAWGGQVTLEWAIECKKWGPEERTVESCGDCPEGKIVGYYRQCLKSGLVDSPTQVTAYKASDGRLFETREEAERHEKYLKEIGAVIKYESLFKYMESRLYNPPMSIRKDYLRVFCKKVANDWPEIKAIMEDPVEKQTGLTPEKKSDDDYNFTSSTDFDYTNPATVVDAGQGLENGGETVFTIMFDNWSEFQAIMEE